MNQVIVVGFQVQYAWSWKLGGRLKGLGCGLVGLAGCLYYLLSA